MVLVARKTYELDIKLSTPEIIMMGSSSESAGKLLQGTVTLNLTEPMKIRSIVLNFLGQVKAEWFEGSGHHQCHRSEEKDIIKHRWQFLPTLNQCNKKAIILAPGEHKWNFELTLPGDLPQSVETESGQVSYTLKATVERPTFSQNIIKRVPVQVVRCVLPSEFELVQSVVITNMWPDKMSYDITMPSKVFYRGQVLCTTFNIRPIASNLKIRSITCVLKESCTYTAKNFKKTDSRIISRKLQDHPFSRMPLGEEWTASVSLGVPSMASKTACCDADCQLIKIRHKIKISMSILNEDGHLSELRCSIPVIIMTAHPGESETPLPAYDQAWRSVLCSEDDLSSSIVSYQPCQLEARSTETDNDPSIWWHGVNLSRVPSYRTASRQSQSIPLSSSLPSYDQLTMT
ncbi:E set domain-containing protein [Backusella circina FSU 941]|nr:E set domain-containing protein [Backusella circina FSU 941]